MIGLVADRRNMIQEIWVIFLTLWSIEPVRNIEDFLWINMTFLEFFNSSVLKPLKFHKPPIQDQPTMNQDVFEYENVLNSYLTSRKV